MSEKMDRTKKNSVLNNGDFKKKRGRKAIVDENMTDSDEESDFGGSVNLTGFLFGNVDEDGHLDNDVFDSETQKHLSSLGKLGLGSLLKEMIEDDSSRILSDSDSDEQTEEKAPETIEKESLEEKLSNAIDFSDITELAEDLHSETNCLSKDIELMPPPAVPKPTEDTQSENRDSPDEELNKKKLDTPLAAMLPSKYANVDVTELFPDFRPGKVLRFSRLFGPGKPSSLPNIWRNMRKKRKKRHRRNSDKDRHHTHDSDGSASDEDHNRRRNRGWMFDYAPEPLPGQGRLCDDEETFLKTADVDANAINGAHNRSAHAQDGSANSSRPKVADWRFGPAQMWYDMLEVSETGQDFNYGFKLRDKLKQRNVTRAELFPDDAFLMVTQLHWEDDVVWDGNDIKAKVSAKLNSKSNAAGWVPSSGNRTAQAFSQPGKGNAVLSGSGGASAGGTGMRIPPIPAPPLPGSKSNNKNSLMSKPLVRQEEPDDTWYSIFPVENEDLVYGKWEDDVIWDAENIDHIPKPSILTLDSNDENIILGVPDDIDPSKQIAGQTPAVKVKIPHPHVKKSKILLGKAGVINVLQEDTPPPPPKSPDRDPFNISNDIYYMPRSSESSMRLKVGGGNLIQHSTPVVELRAPFVPTHMGPIRLRNFHRPPMKRFGNGTLSVPGPHTVLPLLKHIRKKAKSREAERMASGGGDVFFMRSPGDLTGRDGDLILIEYIEEHPPLMSLVGMCSKIKNYYKRKAGKDQGPPSYRFGETAYAHTSPFLGILSPGQSMQAVENNMYRAPIYEHKLPETDFLVIRTREQYYIREVESLFLAGQECPLYEVPGPNSKRANNFVRDFLQVFIYRLFWKSRDTPRRIRMDDIKNAFPSHSESSIRKRLKLCADFKRTGMDSNWWVIKPEFRLPTEEEIRAMVSPEQCCSYFSMVAAEQRLKDAGYGEKFLFTPAEDDDEEMQLKMDDEIKVAPWNTTRAYIQAMKGKCLLQLAGPADPTGCGEGFSYVRVPNKPTQTKEEQESQPKRTVTGTDADLRRLSLNNAKALLRKFGVPEDEIKRLTRWEVIDVVRTLSTEKAKAGEEGMDKFSRGNRFSIAEHQERYKEECQRIFDLQNRVLASEEVLSTDEGESSDEDSDEDIEEMGKNIENMLANKKTSSQLSLEREEQERQELRKMIMEGEDKKGKDKSKMQKDIEDELDQSYAQQGRVLRICRTFRDQDGREYTRVETVRKPAVIDAYVRIRKTKDEQFIRQFATLDEAQKEEMKREKRRIQEQLRRIKRNQERERLTLRGVELLHGPPTLTSANKSAGISSALQSLNSISLTGLSINTSYDTDSNTGRDSIVANRDRENVSLFKERSYNKSLTPEKKPSPIREGRSSLSPGISSAKHSSNSPSKSARRRTKLKTDLKLKCGACGNVGHMRTNKACPLYQTTGGLEFPVGNVSCNTGNGSSVNVGLTMSSSVDIVCVKESHEKKRPSISAGNGREPPVAVQVSGNTVTMAEEQEDEAEKLLNTDDEDLVNVDGTKVKLSGKVLKHAEEMKKRTLLLKVSRESLGGNNRKRRRQTSDLHCDYLKRHNRTANRRRTDPVVVLSTILENILNELRDLPDVQLFLFPVNPKLVMDYYRIIQRPMDLQTIRENLRQKKYQSREEFLSDINQIVVNSSLYNGAKSSLTAAAQRLLQKCVERLAEKEDRLMRLEKAINPLLDDNDQVALTFIFDNVVNTKLKGMQESWPFLKPVNKKMVKDYYNVIKRPMDLETIAKKVAAHKYHSRHDFLVDIQQILENCTLYNGQDSSYTQKAETVVKACKATLDEYADHLSQLESKIALARERAAQDHHNEDMEDDDDDIDDDDFEELQPNEENYTIIESTANQQLIDSQIEFHAGSQVPDDILSALSGAPTASLVNQSVASVTMDLDPDYVDIEGSSEGNAHLQQLTVVGGENADGVAVAHPGGGLSAAFLRTQNQQQIDAEAQQKINKRQRASDEAATLEDDLQCSSEDEDDAFQRNIADIMAVHDDEDVKREIRQLNDDGTMLISDGLVAVEGEDDSQQVAEAMVQLGTIAYYNQAENLTQQHDNQLIPYDQHSSDKLRSGDDLDLDPDYDPSEDFLSSHRATTSHTISGMVKREDDDDLDVIQQDLGFEPEIGDGKPKIHDDLAVSDSEPDDEEDNGQQQPLLPRDEVGDLKQHLVEDRQDDVNVADDVEMLDDDDVWF